MSGNLWMFSDKLDDEDSAKILLRYNVSGGGLYD